LHELLPKVVAEIDATLIVIGHLSGEPTIIEQTELNEVLELSGNKNYG